MTSSRLARVLCGVLALACAFLFSAAHAQNQSPPVVRLNLHAAHEPYRARILAAAEESLTQYAHWLTPLPLSALTITDEPVRQPSPESRGVVTLDLPWLSAEATMDVEAQVAYRIARLYWSADDDSTAAVPVRDGLAWYLQGRIVERLFNEKYFGQAHSVDHLRLFGGTVPWPLPSLRLTRWTAGFGRSVRGDADAAAPAAADPPHAIPGVTGLTIRGARAFGSLERYLGWPTLQGALSALAEATRGESLTLDRVTSVISAAAGQDLSWFFTQAFDPRVQFDYAITQFTTERAAGGCAHGNCFQSSITVRRHGDGVFTGSSRARAESYEAGSGLRIAVAFADGQTVDVRWDGRDAERTFELESPAPATSVRLDADGVLLMDRTPLDHRVAVAPGTNVPVSKWVALWLTWLQDAVMTYGMVL